MKLQINKTVKQEVDVEFPFYTQDKSLFCMFTSVDRGLAVQSYPYSGHISITEGKLPSEWMLNKQCTEDDFMTAFLIAVKTIKTNINTSIK